MPTACILGGLIYFLLLKLHVSRNWLDVVVMVTVFMIRFLAVRYKWSIPSVYNDKMEM